MVIKDKYKLKKFDEYLESDDELMTYIRANAKWNEESFIKMEQIVREVIREYEKENYYPKRFIQYFRLEIPSIINIISHFKIRQDFFAERVKKLKELRKNFEDSLWDKAYQSNYDYELISHLDSIEIKDFTILSPAQGYQFIEHMMKNFRFGNTKVNFTGMKNEKYIRSDRNHIATDVVSFINELIQEGICEQNEKVIYVGDDLTKCEYEFYLQDLLKVIPYLVDNIPQHHYFLFKDVTKLLLVSFEDDIQFGMI